MAGQGGARSRDPRRAHERRLWWRAFLALLLASLAWSFATPLMTGPDESAHAVRAAAVARGQMLGSTALPFDVARNVIVEVKVPEAYAHAHGLGSCFLGKPKDDLHGLLVPVERGSDCPQLEGGHTLVPVLTYEQRGQPVYYATVGIATLPLPAANGAYLMRVITAVICSAALASAAVSALRLARPRLAVLALVVAITPAVIYLAGTINSGGPEVAFGLCLWASGLVLVRGDEPPDGRTITRAGLALVLLALTRGFSPIFAVMTGIGLLGLASPGRPRMLIARRDVRLWLVAGVVALAASAAWIIRVLVLLPLDERPGTGLGFALDQMGWFARHAVAVFGSNDVVPPVALHVAWVAVALGVLAVSLARARRRDAAVVLALLVVTEALQISAEGFSFPPTGFYWQGRYVLLLLGGVLLAGAAVAAPALRGDAETSAPARKPAARGPLRRAGPIALGVLVACHVWAFAYAIRHYTVGHDGPANPIEFLTDPIWRPPLFPVAVFVVVYALAIGGLAAALWRHAAESTASTSTGRDGAGTLRIPTAVT